MQNDKYLNRSDFGLNFEPNNEDIAEDEESYYVAPIMKQHAKRKNYGRGIDRSNSKSEIHLSDVFVTNFNRQLYKDALNKFVTSVSIHILFAYYYFIVLKNVHAALHELKIASKKRPNLYQ